MINPTNLTKLLEVTIPAKEPILIVGSPGIGKTDIISSVCKELEAKLLVAHPVVSDPTDFKGFPVKTFSKEKNRDEAHFIPFGDLQSLIDADKLTVYFFDDFGQAPPSVQAACMQLVLSRRINGFKVSDNVVFIAATNRKQDKAGVSGILEPVKSRFTIVNLEPDLESWVEWAIKNNIRPELTSFIRFRPEMLNSFKPTLEIANCPTPRTIATVARHLNFNLPEVLEFEVICGAAGEGFATEFRAFKQIFSQLPNVDVMLSNPKKTKIPKELSTLYALCGALAYKTTMENFKHVYEILKKLKPEFQTILIDDCRTKNKEIIRTPEFAEWVKLNEKYLF